MTRALLILCLCPLFAVAQPKDADLAAKVADLEKRVAALEAALKTAPAPDPTRTEVANKVVGNWTVTAEDLKDAIFTDLVLKADGMCDVSIKILGPRSGTYKVVGRQLSVIGNVESWNQCRIGSVTDKELVLEHLEGGTVKKVKYNREK